MEQLQKLKEIVESNWNSKEKKLNLKRKLLELESLEADIRVELQNAASSSHKKPKYEVTNWLLEVERVKTKVRIFEKEMGESRLSLLWGRQVERMTVETMEIIEKGRFQGELVSIAHDSSGDALLATELIGPSFRVNAYKIWAFLMKDEFLSIGIYGMAGVGKTALATYVHNQLIERSNNFHYVWWITVSQDFGIYKLQNLIAKTIHLDLSEENDEKKRAAKLSKALIMKHKYVLILDDLWYHFPLEKVGIPTTVSGSKLILTTRSLEVCRRIGCQEKIKVEPLPEEEAWILFKDKLGKDAALSLEINMIAKSITKECAGLPLGIITMAGSMREVDDVCEWRCALEELKESKVRQDDTEELYHVLKFSYIHLNDSVLQHCFLYCALFPEDCYIMREDLIEYLIDEGILDEMESRQAALDKGHAVLNKLENVCLLEGYTISRSYRYVKMHDLIRDMALQIMEFSPKAKAMIKACKQLGDLPDEVKWTNDLMRVSFIGNHVKEPFGYSPRCPNLSTLLLCKNERLELIANSFFFQLQGLKVLDLSYTSIHILPTSVSGLVLLTALLLKNCSMLSHVPSLAKLRMLKRLDLSYSGIEEAPQGLELLSNLRYLNLSSARLKELPGGILPNLSNLQFLKLDKVKGYEIACLQKLEALECHFDSLFEFHAYIQSLEGCHVLSTTDWDLKKQQLSRYYLRIGHAINAMDEAIMDFVHFKLLKAEHNKGVRLYNCSFRGKGDFVLLPIDIQDLTIAYCHDIRSLEDVCQMENAAELKSLLIRRCDGIECLLASPQLSSSILESLETLALYCLKNLQVLFRYELAISPSLQSYGTFSSLKTFSIRYCPSMKRLFPSRLLLSLQNLEEIEVRSCDGMEEMIAVEEQDRIIGKERNGGDSMNHSIVNRIECRLPKLRLLKLIELPELKSICSGIMICDLLQEIYVVDCLKLNKLPVSLPIPSLKRITIHPEKWWELVELDQPNAKKILQPFCIFRDAY